MNSELLAREVLRQDLAQSSATLFLRPLVPLLQCVVRENLGYSRVETALGVEEAMKKGVSRR